MPIYCDMCQPRKRVASYENLQRHIELKHGGSRRMQSAIEPEYLPMTVPSKRLSQPRVSKSKAIERREASLALARPTAIDENLAFVQPQVGAITRAGYLHLLNAQPPSVRYANASFKVRQLVLERSIVEGVDPAVFFELPNEKQQPSKRNAQEQAQQPAASSWFELAMLAMLAWLGWKWYRTTQAPKPTLPTLAPEVPRLAAWIPKRMVTNG